MNRFSILVAAATMGLLLHAHGAGAEPPEGRGYKKTTVLKGSPANPLTGPAAGRPAERALGYVKQQRGEIGLSAADVEDVTVTGESVSAHTGVRHVFVRQRVEGLEVVGADANLSVAPDGSILVFGNSFLSDLHASVNRTDAVLSAADAVAAAARHLGLELDGSLETLESARGVEQQSLLNGPGVASGPIAAKLVYQPVGPDELQLAWQLEFEQQGASHLWHMTIDAESGELLDLQDYTSHDHWPALFTAGGQGLSRTAATAGSIGSLFAMGSLGAADIVAPDNVLDGSSYRVFALPKESPNDGPRTLVANPADATASPFGWHDVSGTPEPDYTVTRGNNVHAYLDRLADNQPDPGGEPDGGPSLTFDFEIDLTQSPSTYGDAAVTNLFYWCNVSHDLFYNYGFDEPSGNFQVNNYGKGGVGGDDVRCEAQDGGGINNANFSTPAADGGRPRMQMFLWNPSGGVPLNLVTIDGPSPAAGTYGASGAAFGPEFDAAGISGDITLANDGTAMPHEGCSPFIGFPAGDIAMVDRGTCTFVQKVGNAQAAGAIAVLVGNNVAGDPITMGGADASITIPSAMVSLDDANTIKAGLPASGNIRANPDAVQRDGDLDAGIVIHEYAHGVSNRLTGGPGINCLTGDERMGEGWSDYYGVAFLIDPALDDPEGPRGMGTYAVFRDHRHEVGIRPAPYSRNMAIQPFTYDSIKSGGWLNGATLADPHGVGHGWAAVLWDLTWDLIDRHGFNPDVYGTWDSGGNNRALQYVTDGLKFQGCGPGFVVGRDAIIAAAEALSEDEDSCTLWAAFARRGLGFSAIQGTTNRDDNDEAFDTHPSCRADFQSPVEAPYGELNEAGAGDTVPLRFDVGPGHGPDILASNSPFSRRVDCGTLTVPGIDPAFITPRELPIATETAGKSGLSSTPKGVYRYNWKTEASWAGTCREVVLTRKDGIQHRAFFQFLGGDE